MFPTALFEAMCKDEFVEPVEVCLEEADCSEFVYQTDSEYLLYSKTVIDCLHISGATPISRIVFKLVACS